MGRRILPAVVLAAVALEAVSGAGRADAEDPPGVPVPENRLAKERSPYLRQHRRNPVDWHPWGPEALERARKEDKPIFLSVGYAACHWCHVMEHESFEDAETARLLNEAFVCVKVDREERPDLDRIYMSAVQILTGRGGWPMSVFLTPDGRPFYGGTYFPREHVRELAKRIRHAWAADRPALERQAETLAAHVREAGEGPALPPATGSDEDLLRGLEAALAASFDRERGGYGRQPKFPPHSELLFHLDRGGANGGPEGLAQARRTLEAMEEGGVHDQVGGGFHRYSTDERWLVPHFEKMLYDNALLAQAYAAIHAVTREERFARTARGILAWVRRDLARPGGGYASSLDADTQGHEGLTYTWTVDELRRVLPPADAELAIALLGAKPAGNYEEEASGAPAGRNILHLPVPLAAFAASRGVPAEDLARRLDGIRARLLEARTARPQPGLDDKVIAGWNGLLLSAFARVGADLRDAAALEDGRRLAAFLLGSCRRADGALLRFPRGSGPEIPGFAEDYVHVAEGLLDLAEAAGEPRWAADAATLAERLLDRFQDEEGGGFYTTAEGDHERLIARTKEAWDSPIPSDNGSAARLLLRLAARTGDERLRAAADRTLAAYRPLMADPRTARGVVALFRALADRRALPAPSAAAEAPAAGPGDARVRQGVADVDAWLERAEAKRGSRVRVMVRVALDPGWHVNAAKVSSPDLVPTALGAAPRSPVVLEEVSYPPATTRALGPGQAPSALYEGAFWVRGVLRVPDDALEGPRKVALVLTLQPCDATSCRAPEEVRLELALRFGPDDGPPRHAGVFAAFAR
jgi:uncharacterized protein YyaL (SSP411 family)